jgi:hypothetical protein
MIVAVCFIGKSDYSSVMDCPRCKTPLVYDGSNAYCPKCGFDMIYPETMPNYSGSIAVMASGSLAGEHIDFIKGMLMSAFSSYQYTGYTPVFQELDRIKEITKGQEEKIAKLQKAKEDSEAFKRILEEYRILVDKNLDEPSYHEFLRANPNILALNVKQTYSKYKLADELIPDFLLILHDSTHLFVELEIPGKRIFNRDGSESADFRFALSQVRNFTQWASSELDFLRKRECPSINSNNIRGLLVIGNTKEFLEGDASKLERINSEYRGLYEIKTFDELYRDRMSDLVGIGLS